MTGEFDGLSLHRLRQRLSTYLARDQAWNTRLWHLPAISEITKTAIVTAKVIELGLKQLFTFITMWRSLVALLLFVNPALAQEHATAYEALRVVARESGRNALHHIDRKSTRLNSSHITISYAVFCLKKKKTIYLR